MFHHRLDVASLALVLAASALVLGADPAYACHEPTGLCCVDREDHSFDDGDFCCAFYQNRVIQCAG
jgi:hypothetical protein